MSDNNDLGAFLAGFVIGGLVGAATALILAPQSGEETRSQIVNQSLALRDAGEASVRHYRTVAETYTHDFLDRAEEMSEQVQEQARIVLDSGKQHATQVKEQVDSYVQKGTEILADDNSPADSDTSAAA
ncbi:MAG: YtxH domain-containing protein [Chloroflexota bacterium]|jgi:gas vesicle protein